MGQKAVLNRTTSSQGGLDMARKFPTPETLEKKIDEYFANCPDSQFPDEAGMLLDLGLFEEDVSYLCEDDPKSGEYQRIFKRAQLRRESWLNRKAAIDSKNSSAYFNLLKQEKNGGYTSTSTPNKGSSLRLIVDGVGGMEAFK